ncbi:hypothetical protein DFH06DRAFT_1127320 [Mycena polygramma]|nr:hypothetical protein DFH06DRAFT_1127320 [Mycena polygramma]
MWGVSAKDESNNSHWRGLTILKHMQALSYILFETPGVTVEWAQNWLFPSPFVSSEYQDKPTAAQWASTALGRRRFLEMFRVYTHPPDNPPSGPKVEIVCRHYPSLQWMESKADELQRIIGDPASYKVTDMQYAKELGHLRGRQAQFLCFLRWHVCNSAVQYRREPDKNQAVYDRELTAQYEKLEAISVEVAMLRSRYPVAGQGEWEAVMNRLLNLVLQRWEWALHLSQITRTLSGEPPAHAMPFPSGAHALQNQVVKAMEHVIPTSFQPSRVFYIPRTVHHLHTLSALQRNCLAPIKADPLAVYLPVLSAVYKADVRELPKAEGECMYSAVQAALISQNARSVVPHLALAVAAGFVRPHSSGWSTVKDYDILLCPGQDVFDLGQLADVVAIFHMMHKAVYAHVEAAFGTHQESATQRYRRHNLQSLPLVPGPLVDWRTRRATGKREGSGKEATKPPSKRQKRDQDEPDKEVPSDQETVKSTDDSSEEED